MAYATADARQQLLDTIAAATDELALALACLGEAYEQLDDYNRETLEEGLFRAVQLAYGRAKRTHTEFAGRHGLPPHAFAQPSAGIGSQGVAAFLERAVEAVGAADNTLGTLQDSMLPIEAGDEQLRSGLAGIREALGGVSDQARALMRTLGR